MSHSDVRILHSVQKNQHNLKTPAFTYTTMSNLHPILEHLAHK